MKDALTAILQILAVLALILTAYLYWPQGLFDADDTSSTTVADRVAEQERMEREDMEMQEYEEQHKPSGSEMGE